MGLYCVPHRHATQNKPAAGQRLAMTMSGLLELNQLFTGKDEADTLFTCTYRSGLTLCGLMTPASRVSAVTKHPHHLMCLLSVETDQKGAMQSCPTYIQLISMRFYTQDGNQEVSGLTLCEHSCVLVSILLERLDCLVPHLVQQPAELPTAPAAQGI
jgi:hypothetical protein